MSDENPTDRNLSWRDHVPNCDGSVLGARHHYSVGETKMKDCFAVVNECLDALSGLNVPDTYSGIRGSGNDDFVVVLKTEDGSGVSGECPTTAVVFAIPDLKNNRSITLVTSQIHYLDGVVSESWHDLVIVVLKTINSLAVLRLTVDPSHFVVSTLPVAVDIVNVADDFGVQLTVEYMHQNELFELLPFEQRIVSELFADAANGHLSADVEEFVPENQNVNRLSFMIAYQWRFSESPCQRVSLRTFFSINFFQCCPLARAHLQLTLTSSQAFNESEFTLNRIISTRWAGRLLIKSLCNIGLMNASTRPSW